MTLAAKDCAELRALLCTKATGYRYPDLARWLQRAGWTPPAKATGSHRVWVHPSGRRAEVRDGGHGEVLPVYAKLVARRILETGGCDGL